MGIAVEALSGTNKKAYVYIKNLDATDKIIIEDVFKFKVIEPKLSRTQDSDILLLSEQEVINYLKDLASSLVL